MSLTESKLSSFSMPPDDLSQVPFRVYTDQHLYAREQECIFRGTTWNFLALECEIPNVGDYKTTYVGDAPVIVVRGQDGDVNALVNRCAHKGALICYKQAGNVREFSCVYHNWTYDLSGKLTGVLPLPRARPPQASVLEKPPISEAPGPSSCRLRLTSDVAIAPSIASITGPGECQATDVVRLEAVILSDRSHVEVTPPAILQCMMAEAVVDWVRQSVAPQALELGSSLKAVENLTSFDCRGRNGIAGAQISEHGKANALDAHPLKLANGRVVVLTDPRASKEFRDNLRMTACTTFTTVLGPGSDGSHED